MEHSKPFKQLLVKEILVNGLWRLYGSTALVIAKLAKYVTISVVFFFNSLRDGLTGSNSKTF